MTNEEEISNNNNENEYENENDDILNEAYDRVSKNGATPSLDGFWSESYHDDFGSSYHNDNELGGVVGDPLFSDNITDEPNSESGENLNSENNADENISIKSLVDGSFLRTEKFRRNIPFIFLLIFMALLQIANRNAAEKLIWDNTRLQREVRDLRAESITIAGQLMDISKETEVSARVEQKKLGIHEQKNPPLYFIIDKFERADSLRSNEVEVPKRDYINDFNDFEDEYKKY